MFDFILIKYFRYPNVGKSSVINTLRSQKVREKKQT